MGEGKERSRDTGQAQEQGQGGKKKRALGMALQKDVDDTNKEHVVRHVLPTQ